MATELLRPPMEFHVSPATAIGNLVITSNNLAEIVEKLKKINDIHQHHE